MAGARVSDISRPRFPRSFRRGSGRSLPPEANGPQLLVARLLRRELVGGSEPRVVYVDEDRSVLLVADDFGEFVRMLVDCSGREA
jgi:hypothetical protein